MFRCQHHLERELDIVGRQRATVVEPDSFAQPQIQAAPVFVEPKALCEDRFIDGTTFAFAATDERLADEVVDNPMAPTDRGRAAGFR